MKDKPKNTHKQTDNQNDQSKQKTMRYIMEAWC